MHTWIYYKWFWREKSGIQKRRYGFSAKFFFPSFILSILCRFSLLFYFFIFYSFQFFRFANSFQWKTTKPSVNGNVCSIALHQVVHIRFNSIYSTRNNNVLHSSSSSSCPLICLWYVCAWFGAWCCIWYFCTFFFLLFIHNLRQYSEWRFIHLFFMRPAHRNKSWRF